MLWNINLAFIPTLYRYRIDFHRFQIEVQSVMLNQPVAEHPPQDVAAQLRQCGIDEQILLFQSFRQRAARTGIFLLHARVFHQPGDDFQRAYSFVEPGNRLLDFLRYRSQHDLTGCLRVSEVHPIEGRLVISVFRNRHGFQRVPQVDP